MQDDNLEHMEYLLTKESYKSCLLSKNYKIRTDIIIKNYLISYLKEHGLPLDSEIKD